MNANRLVTLLAALAVSTLEFTGFFTLVSLTTSAQLAAAAASRAAVAAAPAPADLPEIVVTAHRPS